MTAVNYERLLEWFMEGPIPIEEIADWLAKNVLASEEPSTEIRLRTQNGSETQGVAFFGSDGTLIVTDEIIGIPDETGKKLDLFIPRRRE